MTDLQINNVPSENQNSRDYFYLGGGNGIRVLFVGNSITRHEPKPEIGWMRECGMAASETSKDYVHLTASKIAKLDPEMSFSILQVAEFERNFESKDILRDYKEAIDYKANIIIMFFGANVSKEYDKLDSPKVRFGDRYAALRNALCSQSTTEIFHVEGFYVRPVLNAEKRDVALNCGDTYIELGDIVTREDTHGSFNHPGDKGMSEISDKIFEFIEPAVKRYLERK